MFESDNSKIWRRTTEFFSIIAHNFALYRTYAEKPQNVDPFLCRVPLKMQHSTKFAIFEAPCTKCVRDWCSRYGAFFRSFSVLPKGHSMICYICVNLSARGPTVGACLRIWPSLGAKFRGDTRFRKLLKTAIEGAYISCKFDVDIPRDCGDIAPRILDEKRKWNRLWEISKIKS